jgi:hypothetical protein
MKNIIKYSLGIITMGIVCSCGPKLVDYHVKSDWIYINESSHDIRVEGYENFDLAISDTYTINRSSTGPETVTEEAYQAPFRPRSTKVIVDGDRVYTWSKITDRKNYTAEKAGVRYCKFTYTFTDADFPGM